MTNLLKAGTLRQFNHGLFRSLSRLRLKLKLGSKGLQFRAHLLYELCSEYFALSNFFVDFLKASDNLNLKLNAIIYLC